MAKSNILSLGDVELVGNHLKVGSFINFDPPVKTGLKEIYILGGDAESSLVNRVNGQTTANVSGSPTFNSGFGAILNWANHINLNHLPTDDSTYITISKPRISAGVSTTENAILSNKAYEGSLLVGEGLHWLKLPQLEGKIGTNGNSTSNAVANNNLDSNKWAAAFMYVSKTNMKARAGMAQNGWVSWSFSEANLTSRKANSTSRNLRIGATALNANSEQTGDAEVGLVMIYDGALTQAQIVSVVSYISGYLNDAFGITDI